MSEPATIVYQVERPGAMVPYGSTPLTHPASPPSPFRQAFGDELGRKAVGLVVVAAPTLIFAGIGVFVCWRAWKRFQAWRAERAEKKSGASPDNGVRVRVMGDGSEVMGSETSAPPKRARVRKKKAA